MNPRIQLLGPVRAWHGEAEVDLGPSRQKGLLALLALAAGQPLSRPHLTEALWGDNPPASYTNVIQVYITRLRRAFEPERAPRRPSQLLPTIGDGYALVMAPESVDALGFRRALAEAARARRAGDPARVKQLLASWLASWRTPLQGASFHSDQSTISSLVDDRWTAVVWHAAAAIETGEAEQVLASLEEAAEARPWDETTQALLIRALHAVGRRADAIIAYRKIRQSFRDDLGVEPGHELTQAFGAILSDTPEEADLDAARPAVVGGLPPRTAHFTGRADELAALRPLLSGRPARVQVVCVEGPAGVGKTGLALELAHALAPQFPDGQLFIDLRGHDPTVAIGLPEALACLLRSLGVDESERGDDELSARYRATVAGRALLIVLDNAGGAEQILPLLPATPACVVIVTSRYSLTALSAQLVSHRHDLAGLSTSDSLALLARVTGKQRTANETEAAAELVRLCGGLPLALRLVAARLASRPRHTFRSMAAELAVASPDPALGAFQPAYGALSKPEARAFRLLSLHPGTSFTTDMVAALTNLTLAATQRLLDTLSRAHLIEALDGGRYRFHDLLGLFAAELLDAQETLEQRDAALHRLMEWYLDVTDGANRLINPARDLITRPANPRPLPFTADAQSALDYLSAEADNLPLIVREAALHGFDTECWQLTYFLFSFYGTGSRPADFVDCADWGLRAARRTGDRRAEAIMLGIAGAAAGLAQRLHDAIDLHRRQIAVWQELGDRVREAMAWYQLGATYCGLHRHEESLAAYQRGLDLCVAAGDAVQCGFMLSKVGYKARDLGDLGLSDASLQRALMIWREAGDAHSEARALYELGKTKLFAGDRAAAFELLGLAHGLQHGIGDHGMAALSLHWMGKAHVRAGEATRAVDMLEKALELFRDMGDEHGESAVLTTLASACTALDDPSVAQEHLKRARTLRERVPDPLEEGLLHDAISTLAARTGDTRRAEAHRAAANTRFAEAGCFEARQRMSGSQPATNLAPPKMGRQ